MLYLSGIKNLLVFGLLVGTVGCSSTDSEPAHTAVTQHVKVHANEPISYGAMRWSTPAAFTRRDSAAAAVERLSCCGAAVVSTGPGPAVDEPV